MDAELRFVAEATNATDARRAGRIQSVWSGYGEIFRVELIGASVPSVIVKSVRPPADLRGSRTGGASHVRKCRSYDVELVFYRKLAARCDVRCRVPSLIASRAGKEEWLFVLEDLDAAGFSERRRRPSASDLDACASWLAAFHARFLGVPPDGLWKSGTYWHLATRPDELAAIDDAALRSAAPELDRRLRSCQHQTIVHGDAKPENFCFTRGSVARGSAAVAAVDFQYAGGGCGMKDVAYLLSGSCDGSSAVEERHLDHYFGQLAARLAERSDAGGFDADALEREWRALYPIACADFYRFLAGWAKDHWRRDAYGQQLTARVLRSL